MATDNLRDNETLVDALRKAIENVPEYDNPLIPREAALCSMTPELVAFHDQLRFVESLEIFDNTLQVLGDGEVEFNFEQLGLWILARSDAVGARQALADVDRYIEEPDFQAYEVMFLSGILPNKTTEFEGGISLIPISLAPTMKLLNMLPDELQWRSGALLMDIIQGLLVRPYRQKKEHHPQEVTQDGETSRAPAASGRDLTYLNDVRLCLALPFEEGLSVQAIATTIVTADEVPTPNRMSFISHSYRGNARYWSVLQGEEEKTAKSLYKKFRKISRTDREHLRIPMQRYCDYIASAPGDRAQAAIDLRVALESLFLSDNEQLELNYRLALRAALFVGGTLEDRTKIRKDIKSVYHFGSKAVHSGTLELNLEESQQFSRVEKIVRNVIIKMIRTGQAKQNWGHLELGFSGAEKS